MANLRDSIVALADGDASYDVAWTDFAGLSQVLGHDVSSHAEAHQQELGLWAGLHILCEHEMQLVCLS